MRGQGVSREVPWPCSFACGRFAHPPGSRTSQQAELPALGPRATEKVSVQLQVTLVEPEPPGGEPKAGADLLGIRATPALTMAEGSNIVLAAVHGAQDADDTGGPVGELGRE